MCRRVSGLYLSGAATRLEKHSDQLYSYVSAFCLCIFVVILIRRILYAQQDVGSTMCSIERRIRWVSYSNYIALFDVVQCLRWAHLCLKSLCQSIIHLSIRYVAVNLPTISLRLRSLTLLFCFALM